MAIYYGDANGKAQEVVVVGMQGPAGPQGPAGQGVPAGGTAGQVLMQSNDGPVWANIPPSAWNMVYNTTPFQVYSNGELVLVMTTTAPAFPSTYQDYNFGGLNYKRGTASTGTIIPPEYCPNAEVSQYFRIGTNGVTTEITISSSGSVVVIVTAPYLSGSEETPSPYWGTSQQIIAFYPIINE